MSTPYRQGPPAADTQATAGCEAVSSTTVRRVPHWPRIVLALAAVYIFWGSSYIAIKTAGQDFPPLLLVGLRNALAGALFLTLAFAQRRPLGRLREWGHACVVGVLMISVGATLLAMGMRYASPGMAAVTFACVPVVVCLMLAFKGHPISLAQWLGTLMGVSGMWMISRGAGEALLGTGLVLILAAVLVTAASAVLMDHWSMPQDLVVTAGVQMLAGGVVAAVAGWLWGERIESVSPPAWAAWLYLSLIVSGLGYLAYTYLMAHTGPVLASSYAYVNPPIALLVDAVALGTQLGNATLLATAVVLTGAVIAMWATPSKSRQTAIPASAHSHGGAA